MKMKVNTMLKTITITLGGIGLFYAASSPAADGKTVYDTVCKMCHGTGVMGAPKFGDKAQWEERSSKGVAALEQNAIKGYKGKKGSMPPKGGKASLSDDEVKAAVAYMLDSAK